MKKAPNQDKLYYHGTAIRNAFSIMTDGFKIGEMRHGRWLGRGLYVAQRPESAWNWAWTYGHQGGTIIACRLEPGTRVLWVGEECDKRVIAYLRREFGKELLDLGPNFDRAIPSNKQLSKNELIHLCNYVFQQRGKLVCDGRRWARWVLWEGLSRLSQHVRRHQYDAIGDRSFRFWDSDEIMVFEPSRVSPVSAHLVGTEGRRGEVQWPSPGVPLPNPLDLDVLRRLSKEARRAYEERMREFDENGPDDAS